MEKLKLIKYTDTSGKGKYKCPHELDTQNPYWNPATAMRDIRGVFVGTVCFFRYRTWASEDRGAIAVKVAKYLKGKNEAKIKKLRIFLDEIL